MFRQNIMSTCRCVIRFQSSEPAVLNIGVKIIFEISIFWDVMLCSLVEILVAGHHFQEDSILQLHGMFHNKMNYSEGHLTSAM